MTDMSTADITKDRVLEVLQLHKGKCNGIHMRSLVVQVTNQVITSDHLERKVRELVSELRGQGHAICAHPASGYYIAETDKELEDTCRFLLERSQSTVDQVCAMTRALPIDLYHHIGIRR